MLDGKYLGKGSIKQGSVVGQDHHFGRWNDAGEIFDVYEFTKDRYELVAYGYGQLGTQDGKGYGNGRLYVNKNDIYWRADMTPTQSITSWGWA